MANTDAQALAPSGIAVNSATGTTMVRGLNATVFSMNDPTTSTAATDTYLAVSAGGVTNAGTSFASQDISNQIAPFVQLLFPPATGTQSSVKATNLPAGNASDGTPITADITQAITNASVSDTLDTAIGTYTNVIKQVTTINGTATAGSQSVTVTGTTTSWLAPGAGVVKEMSSATVQGMTMTETFDVRSYKVGGVPHGFGPELTAGTNIDAGGDSIGAPAIATDGTNFLVAYLGSRVPGGASDAEQYVEGKIITPDGTVLSTFQVSPSVVLPGGAFAFQQVVAGFDGSNYMVVFAQFGNFAGADETLWAVQVSPTGTVTTVNASPLLQPYRPGNTVRSMALAFDGAQYLLVYQTDQVIYGQFISPGTQQFVGPAFALDPGDVADHPAVAFNGTNYLVAWDSLGGASPLPTGTYAALVSPAGSIVGAAPIPVYRAVASGWQYYGFPAIASDGNQFLLTYLDNRNSGSGPTDLRVSASRISATGSLLDGTADTPGIVVTDGTSISEWPTAVTYYSGLFRLLWGQYGALTSPILMTAGSVTPVGKVANSGTLGVPLSSMEGNGGVSTWNIGSNSHGALMAWMYYGFPRGLRVMPIYPP